MICQRCAKIVYAGQEHTHTCIPTEGWRKLVSEVESLKSDIAVRNQYVEELRQRERELFGRIEELEEWQQCAFAVHSNIDLDIDALKKLEEK